MKHWFITGISRGLGRALAEAAMARGDTVVGTVRDLADAPPAGPGALHLLILDVSDRAAVGAAVDRAFALAGGRIDVVVNNAGFGLLGAIEEATPEEVDAVFATNFHGTLHVVQAALPRLRAQSGGHIINITSIAGHAPGTGAGLYAAAKHAVEGLTKCLAQEVAPFGIKVTAVAPGTFRTDFASDRTLLRSAPAAGVWTETVDKVRDAFGKLHGHQPGDPARAAQVILRVVDAPDPPLHLLLGSDALGRAQAKFAAVAAEVDAWAGVSASTDFPPGT